MRPKKFQSTRVGRFLIVPALIVPALLFPAIYRAAEPLLVGISIAPAPPKIFVGQTRQYTATLHFNDGSNQPASAPMGSWASTGSLSTPRYYHTATRLLDGTVLVVGGFNGSFTYATAELYNPASGLWTSAGNMGVPRAVHTATLLPNGKVLVVGGINYPSGTLTNTVSLYDPGTNSWSMPAPLLNGPRAFHVAVGLNSGDVLVTAGLRFAVDCTYRTQTEIYDWVNSIWKHAGPLNLARSNATAILLDDGKVLVAGGPANNCPTPNIGLDQAEMFDPATDEWSVLSKLSTTRYNNFIAKLPNGRVLMAGGYNHAGITASADVFTPTATGGTFALTAPMTDVRAASGGIGDNGLTVADGQVLVAGGQGAAAVLSSAELFNPATATWLPTGSLLTARAHNTITSLENGQALVVGGITNGGVPLASAEIYQPDFVWESSNPTVAEIDQTGQATALAPGTTIITARSGSFLGTMTLTVEPTPQPTAAFTANPNPAACGQTVLFNATLSHAAPGFSLTKYEWDFGDGATGTGATATHAYPAFGTYSATLTVSDNNSPPFTDVETVLINVNQGNQAPTASPGGPYIFDLGAPVILNGAGSSDPDAACGDSIVSYSWSINNGTITADGAGPTLTSAQITALGAGTFPVSLTVADEFGVSSTASTTLAIYNNVPTASFTAAPNPAACGQPITFNGTLSAAGRPDRAIVGYQWDFGDGASGAGPIVTHAYSQFGTFTVTLAVIDNNVPPRQATTTIPVSVSLGNHTPIANIGGPYIADFGAPVVLDATGSTDPDAACGDSIVSYSWSINNGALTLNGASPSLSATQVNALGVGTFPLSLTVTDEFGQAGTASTTLSIYNNVPTASFTAAPNPAACGQPIAFNGTLSAAGRPDRAIVSYQWNFGDNTTGTGATATHGYAAFGTYSVTLTVTDNNVPPRHGTTTIPVSVSLGNHAPIASHGGPYVVDLGSPAFLDGTGSSDADTACGDSIASYSWSVNNGALTLNGASPSLSAAQINALGVGTFPVSLMVTDEFGQAGTASTTLSIYHNVPTASFFVAPNPAACGQPSTFDANLSSAGRPDRAIVSYQWNFGDNTTASGATVTHAYAAFGTYNATLTVTDNNVPAQQAVKTIPIDVNQGNFAPFANAGGPYTVNAGSTVQLDGSLSSDLNTACGDQIVAYEWNIDGLYQLSGVTPTLNTATNPLSPGNHNVTLTVRDSFGLMSSASTSINVQRVLVSIAVTPTPVTLQSGQHQMFTATGTFSDGSTETLMSSGGGGSAPPSFGLNDPTWQIQFQQQADFSVCSTPQYPLTPGTGSFSSQNLLTRNGQVDMLWSALTPVVEVKGTITLTDVVLTLACTNGAAFGTIDATWTGTRYEGQLFFNNGATQSSVSITGWSRQAAMPTARFGLTALAYGGKVYAIGGTAGTCNGQDPCQFAPLPTVEAYDPANDSWSLAAPLNHGREGGRAIVLDDKWYVIGGHVPGGQASGAVEVLDPAGTNTWSELTSDPMPTPRANFALVTDGTYLYAIGGDTTLGNGGQVATVERFDPAAPAGQRWTSLASLPVAGNFIGAGVLNGTIVVVGAGGTNRTDLYDIAGDTWSPGVPMPAQRGAMASAVANGGLWLMGGTTDGALNYDTWVYYPATPTRPAGWAGVGSMLTGRTTPAAATIGDVIYVPGGADASNIALGSNEALSTPPFEDLSTSGGAPGGGSGNTMPTVQWLSTNPSAASIDGNGNASARSAGQTTIVATSGNISCQAQSCATLTVTNTVPAVQIFGGPFMTNESANFQNFSSGGNFTDPDQQSWTATVNYGDGTGTQPLMLSNLQNGFTPTGQFNLVHTYADNGVFTVTVTVDDHAGGIGTATAQVTVNNVAPQVSGPMSSSTNAGSSMTFGCISFFDVPADAPWTATVNYGDGSGDQMVTPNVPGSCGGGGTPAGAFSLSHVYASGGNFTITAKVTDKDQATGMRSFPIAVNAAPAVTIDNMPLAAINEGGTFTGTASFTDAMGDGPWTVRINYGDNTGQFQSTVTNLGSIPLNHPYRDNGTYTISVQVQDKFFLSAAGTATLTVNNVAPTVNTLPTLNAITEGQQVNFTINYSDPGLNDNQSPGFRAQINWGDGSAIQNIMNLPFSSGSGTGNFFVNHTYPDNPAAPNTAFTITVTVTDKDGAASSAKTTQLVVDNAPPSVQLTNFPDLVEGVPATFTGQLFDQGALDAPWSGEVDFGDGVAQPFSFTLNPQGQMPRGTFSVTHTYSHSGPVTVTLRATDKDGTTGIRTFQFDVEPVMVSAAVNPTTPWLNAVGQTLQFNGSALFSDGSMHHTDGNVIPGVSWSSSNHAVAMISESGLATATGPGVTTITLTVDDDLDHQFTATATLRVDVTPPVITADDITALATSGSGATVTLVFSATDDVDSNPTVVADHDSGTFPIGTTDVIVTATDAAGNTSTKTMKVTVVDATPPSITVPADITVDATSPEGAIVNYSASATDAVGGNIAVICLPPPGTFPIGTTTVTCTATDAAGNTATATFTVLVQAAAAQVTQLMATVQNFNLQQGIADSLDAKLDMILDALNEATSGNSAAVCNKLGAFINETQAQSGKKLTEAQANQLIAAAQQIQAVIGCQ